MDHSSAHFPFGDIEQDNNPSFYGNHSVINNPYGGQPTTNEPQTDNDEVKNLSQLKLNGELLSHSDKNGPARAMSSRNAFLDINDSLIMLSQIASMLTNKDVKIEDSSTERLVNYSVIKYRVQVSDGINSTAEEKRRYSEFKSLRDTLARLFLPLVGDPIP